MFSWCELGMNNIYWLSSIASHASCSSNSLSSSIIFVMYACFFISFSYASSTLERTCHTSFPGGLLSIRWRSDFLALVSAPSAFLRLFSSLSAAVQSMCLCPQELGLVQEIEFCFPLNNRQNTPIRRKSRI